MRYMAEPLQQPFVQPVPISPNPCTLCSQMGQRLMQDLRKPLALQVSALLQRRLHLVTPWRVATPDAKLVSNEK